MGSGRPACEAEWGARPTLRTISWGVGTNSTQIGSIRPKLGGPIGWSNWVQTAWHTHIHAREGTGREELAGVDWLRAEARLLLELKLRRVCGVIAADVPGGELHLHEDADPHD